MINIFIGLSNNQISNCESILLSLKGNNHNILITNKTLEFQSNLWDEIISSEITFNNQPTGLWSSLALICSKIKSYKQIVKQLRKYSTSKEITLYFSYIEDILSNHLLLSFNHHLKGVVVEDGTLNYYLHTIKNIPPKKRYMKWLLSNLMFLRYKLYEGHSSGIEYSHVEQQYVRIPELSMFSQKSKLLPFTEKEINLKNNILIIGQEPYTNMFGLETYLNALLKLIKIIKQSPDYENIKDVYYKPHRHGQRIDYKTILSDNFQNKEVSILCSDKPLEKIYFEQIKSKNIYSFDSSALLNIFIESSEENRKNISFNTLLRFNFALEPIFKKFNFNIYK